MSEINEELAQQAAQIMVEAVKQCASIGVVPVIIMNDKAYVFDPTEDLVYAGVEDVEEARNQKDET